MLKTMRARFLAVATLACAVVPANALAQDDRPISIESEPSGVTMDSAAQANAIAPVVVRGDTLFFVYGRIGPFSPADRAAAIERRLDDIIRNPTLDVDEVTAVVGAGAYDIMAGDVVLMTVTEDDAAGSGGSLESVARDYATSIEVTLDRAIRAFSLTSIALGILYTLLATAVLVAVLRLFSRVFPTIYRYVGISLAARLPSLRFQKLELLSGARVARTLVVIARAIRVVLTLILLYFYLPLVLSFFPWTRRLSGEIIGWVTNPLRDVADAVLDYLPNLFTILVIVVVVYYGIKLVKQFFLAIQSSTISFPGFYPEWAEPTYKIVRFLIIALAVIMVWPYLPNSESEAFKGVAAFLGLLITFGSAGMIGNVVGGIMLTYMRAFRVGDRVKIADTVGDVIDQDLLVTRIRTTKKVDITIPNSLVLGAHIINWSKTAAEGGVILHTGVTIGYDVPWRQVHELLISAAQSTDGILAEPTPFVLQTSLDDFYVSYELNAYTDQPGRMAGIYSELHSNIQDRFNEGGVEILSPHYGAHRDGNTVTIPQNYLPKDYEAPAFRLFRLGK